MEDRSTAGGVEGGRGGSFGRGVDSAQERRPGVPMEREPRRTAGASWDEPERQPPDATHYKRKGLPRLTPVYGTAQPPHGVSGMIRHAAYEIPEHRASHWALLLAADRVDVIEHRLARLAGETRLLSVERGVRERPLAAVVIAGIAGLMLARATR